MIGILGDIPFQVSFDGSNISVLNFKTLKRSGASTFERHERKGQKPILEFSSVDTEKITLDIQLRRDFGIDPLEQIDKLEQYKNEGQILDFLLGDKEISSGKYVILSYEIDYQKINNNGVPKIVEVSLSLEEYVEMGESTVKKVTVEKKNTVKKTLPKKRIGGPLDY